MGLDAAVRCRCWEDGEVTSPPPFAESVSLDEEGWLSLNLTYVGNREKHEAFHQWLETCCEHCKMEFADEYIANWTGYRLFQQKLRFFGIEQFPALAEILPEANGGQAPSAKSAIALLELDDFSSRDFGSKVVLINAETGDEIQQYVESYQGRFLYSPDGTAGVDPQGYFVCHASRTIGFRTAGFLRRIQKPRRKFLAGEKSYAVYRTTSFVSRFANWLVKDLPQQEVFRSMRFKQEQVGKKSFQLTDERTGARVTTSFAADISEEVPGPPGETRKWVSTYPTLLAVERRKVSADDFNYILKPLRVVFKASVETGNPVCWR